MIIGRKVSPSVSLTSSMVTSSMRGDSFSCSGSLKTSSIKTPSTSAILDVVDFIPSADDSNLVTNTVDFCSLVSIPTISNYALLNALVYVCYFFIYCLKFVIKILNEIVMVSSEENKMPLF